MEERIEHYENGVLVSVIDTRTLTGEKARRIATLKEAFAASINEAYPPYKQSNAALGLLDPEEAEGLRVGLQTMRMQYEAKKSTINSADSLEELDAIYDDQFATNLSLAEAKKLMVQQIDTLLLSKQNNSQFEYAGNTFRFHSDAVAKATGLQTLVNAGIPFPEPFSWQNTSGVEVTMNQAEFTMFGATMGNYQMQLDIIAKTKAYMVSQLTTVAEVLAFDVTGGW